jgi:hypothetical protein
MAFTATDSSPEARSFSLGPVKMQIVTWTCVSGDTTGTITADKMAQVFHVILDGGLDYTAAPTYATNVATLAFTDPVASRYGTALLIGR